MKENKHIDQRVKDALEHYEMPFEPAHWNLMESRLRAHRAPHSASVIALKSIEVLLMSVALFSMLHYANSSDTTATEYATAQSPAIAVQSTAMAQPALTAAKTALTTVERPLAQTTTTNTNETDTPYKAVVPTGSVQYKTTLTNTNNVAQYKPLYMPTNLTQNAVQTKLPDDEHIVIEAAPSIVHDGNIKTTNPQRIINEPTTKNQQTHNAQSTNQQPSTNEAPTNNQGSNSELTPLPSLPVQPLTVPNADFDISIHKSMPIADASHDLPYETALQLRRQPILKGSAGYEISTVSQFSREGVQATTAKSNRFGLGIVFNIFKKINFETAIELTHKNYQTANALQAFANSSSSQVVQNTSMLLAEIPLCANITIVESKKYKLYIKAGTRFASLLTAQYIWRNGADATYTTYNASLSSTSRINNAQYEEITNATNFWSLGGGIGVCYHLSPRVSVFAEPSIYHALNGIGQRKDFINSIGLGLGASCVL